MKTRLYRFFFIVFLSFAAYFFLVSCSEETMVEPVFSEELGYTIVGMIPHDPNAFTQGLLFDGDIIYESTGLYGFSSLRSVDIDSGNITHQIDLTAQFFAEGLALKDGQLVQLTWQENTALIYSIPDLAQIGSFSYAGQGWGLTSNGSSYIMSNGSDSLFFRDDQFRIEQRVQVTLDGQPVEDINELEYAAGRIYANVWKSNFIYVIVPETGEVESVVDLTDLVIAEGHADPRAVLNGIAYHAERGTFFCTGKLWSQIFEIRLE